MVDGLEIPRKRDNSRVTSALITGAFGLMGTVATIVAMRQPASRVEPTTASATEASILQPTTPTTTVVPQQTAAPQPEPASTKPQPNLLLNFVAFQEHLATADLSEQQRAKVLRPLLGRIVVWKGYVDAVTPMANPTEESAITVSLVESLEKTHQSMLKTPAYVRFGPEELDEVANLAPGDYVTISGTLADHSLIGTNVTGTRLMMVNGRMAGRTASAPSTQSAR